MRFAETDTSTIHTAASRTIPFSLPPRSGFRLKGSDKKSSPNEQLKPQLKEACTYLCVPSPDFLLLLPPQAKLWGYPSAVNVPLLACTVYFTVRCTHPQGMVHPASCTDSDTYETYRTADLRYSFNKFSQQRRRGPHRQLHHYSKLNKCLHTAELRYQAD